jgi:hypothetical protein
LDVGVVLSLTGSPPLGPPVKPGRPGRVIVEIPSSLTLALPSAHVNIRRQHQKK